MVYLLLLSLQPTLIHLCTLCIHQGGRLLFRPIGIPLKRDCSLLRHQSLGFSLFQNSGNLDPGYHAEIGSNQDTMPDTVPGTPGQAHSEQGVVLGPGSVTMTSELDGERLREACAAMDEFYANGPSRRTNWCVLMDSGNNGLCTMREVLFERFNSHVHPSEVCKRILNETHDLKVCKKAIEELLMDGKLAPGLDTDNLATAQPGTDLYYHFVRVFNEQITGYQEKANFVAAHSWFRKLRSFQALVASESGLSNLLSILEGMTRNRERYLTELHTLTESCELWIRAMVPRLEIFNKDLLLRAENVGRLRDKMWYVAEVRTSGPYDEVRSIASALKVMGKLRRNARVPSAPPLRHWNTSKASSTGLHLKSEAQILDILSAPPENGGPNKLSDDQSKALSMWMEKNAVENLCKGEERLLKLCMEVRKGVDQLTAENSTLLSSALFARDKGLGSSQPGSSMRSPFWSIQAEAGRLDLLTLRTNIPPSIDSLSSVSSHPLSASSSRDYLDSRSPTMTTRSSAPFWSPVMTEARSPSSTTSIGSSQTHAAPVVSSRKQWLGSGANNQSLAAQLRQRTTSLLLSELGSTLFSEGSETDRAFWMGLGGDLSEKHLGNLRQSFEMGNSETPNNERFDFESAFETLVNRFSGSSSPFAKLAYLLDIDTLLAPYMSQEQPSVSFSKPGLPPRSPSLHQLKRQSNGPVVDTKVEGFRRLFCNSLLRPKALFRDLQYIAALIPSTTLESTPQGKAFWNAAVAVSGLKQEIRQIMIETADSIIAYQSNNRGHGRSPSAAQLERDSAAFSVPSRTPSAEDVSRYTMSDAAYLLQITAKEGEPVAQRELATLYLTHPELMDHIIAPLTRPRDVFKEELESKWRKNQDPNRCDPTTMCVAHHWMSLSSKGGDALAKEYLRQREEMDRLG